MADVLSVLVQIARGQAIEEIGREFNAVMAALQECGGSGELAIKIKMEAKGWNHNSGQLAEVSISHSVGSKRPKRKLGSSTFFLTGEGELTRNDPAQMELDDMMDERDVKHGKR